MRDCLLVVIVFPRQIFYLSIDGACFVFMVATFFVLGLIIGSFLNVVIWRLPKDRSLGGRSECPYCKTVLHWYDLVPVLSYLALRGRCRYCQKKISVRYPAIELVHGILYGLASAIIIRAGSMIEWLDLFIACLVVSTAVVVFVIDLEHYLILDKVVFPALALAVGLLVLKGFFSQDLFLVFSRAVVGVLSTAFPLYLIWYLSKGRMMGFGDVKYMVFIGTALGWPNSMVAFLLTFWLGTLIALPMLLLGWKSMQSKLPLGVFISVAAVVSVLFSREWQSLWGRLFYF